MSDIAINIKDIWKGYKIGSNKSMSFRESFQGMFRKNNESFFWALQEIDVQIQKGEAVGIIGRNGAGKSTLLKILSKITYPTKGRIEIDGRVSSLLEVGTGFHPELTGRQNIFLNGTILGMTRVEINRKFDEIVAFSGVEKFIDTPVKHFSSGMKVRLAFSVAAHLEPEILIIDEVLAVGDAEFQKKCLGKMEDATEDGRTVLFVSHNMGAIRNLCQSGILLDFGKVSLIGEINDVVNHYLTYDQNDDSNLATYSGQENSDEIHSLKKFSLIDSNGEVLSRQIDKSEDIYIEILIDVKEVDPSFNIGYSLSSVNGEVLYWSFFKDCAEKEWPRVKRGENKYISKIPVELLNDTSYRIEYLAALHHKKWLVEPGRSNPQFQFDVIPGEYDSPLLSVTKRKSLLLPILPWTRIEKP
ncbi:MAG: ABC transporter ATP-binding protein [Bacteroidota bacterium]